jgi:hypothetical protein
MRQVVAALLIVTSGCSFVLTSSPPDNYQRLPSVDCASDYTWPVIDVAVGALVVSSAIGGGSASEDTTSRGTAVVAGLAIAAVAVVSAVVGFGRVQACKRAKQEWFAAHTASPTPPAAAASPWGPPVSPPQQPASQPSTPW